MGEGSSDELRPSGIGGRVGGCGLRGGSSSGVEDDPLKTAGRGGRVGGCGVGEGPSELGTEEGWSGDL